LVPSSLDKENQVTKLSKENLHGSEVNFLCSFPTFAKKPQREKYTSTPKKFVSFCISKAHYATHGRKMLSSIDERIFQ